MGPKKTAKVNAFWLYVLDYKDRHKLHSISNTELTKRATPQWKNLSPALRKEYEEKAKIQNNQREKLTTTGQSIDEIEYQKHKEERKLEQMEFDITKTVERLKTSNTLIHHKYYLIHMHFYCFGNEKYFPAEVGIVCFSLKNGIEDTFQKIIYSGKLPLGMSGEAKAHREETHQIENVGNQDNLSEVSQEMEEFLMNGNSELPIVYTRHTGINNKEIVENILHNFFEGLQLKVYSLEQLFFQIAKSKIGADQIPSITFAISELDRDVYEFTTNTACDYHLNCDYKQECSLSKACRYAYTICSYFCKPFNIEPIPEKHIPKSFVTDKVNIVDMKSTKYSVVNDEKCVFNDFVSEFDTETLVENQSGTWCTAASRRKGRPGTSEYSFASTMSQNTQNGETVPETLSFTSPASQVNKLRRPHHAILSQSDLMDPMENLNLSQNSTVSGYSVKSDIDRDFPSLGVRQASGAIPRVSRGRGRGFNKPKN